MTNADKLNKVVDYTLELADRNSRDSYDHRNWDFSQDGWHQGDWVQLFAPVGTDGDYVLINEAEKTDDGLIYESDKGPFKCSTAGCIAGNTALLFAPKGTKFYSSGHMKLPGEESQIGVEQWAAQELDINESATDALFNGSTDTPEEIRGVRDSILAGKYDENGRTTCQ